MEPVWDEHFVLFLRCADGPCDRPDRAEQPVASYPSYAEARRAQSLLSRAARTCVIRSTGLAGGGD